MSEQERIEKLQTSLIKAELRATAAAEGVTDGALADVLNYDRAFQVNEAGQVRTPDGQSPGAWLKAMRPSRSHWFGAAKADGENFANNPWMPEHWNKTEQGRVYKADQKKAEQMAAAAGCDVFSVRPAKK